MYNHMVVHSESLTEDDIDRLFRALADSTRRDIVRRTMSASTSVSELADDYAMSFAAVQKHVAVLEHAGLVSKERRGRHRLVRADPDQVGRARALLDQLEALAHARFGQLDAVLAEQQTTRQPDTPVRSPNKE